MTLHAGTYVVAEGGLEQLKSTQRMLRGRGVSSEIVSPPPAQCSS